VEISQVLCGTAHQFTDDGFLLRELRSQARLARQGRPARVGGDPHDVPMAMDDFTWLVPNAERTMLFNTRFAAEMAEPVASAATLPDNHGLRRR